MNIKDLVRAIAPTAATLLGGPLAGMAVKALGDAIGMDDATEEKIGAALTGGQLSGEQIVAMKQADNALKLKMAELGIKAEELVVDDRKNARAMQVDVKSYIPGALAVGVTIGFFGVLTGMMTGYLKTSGNSEALLVMLGALGTAWGAVVNFYFGSSSSSQAKDATLAEIAKG